jgi:hypothetical protein
MQGTMFGCRKEADYYVTYLVSGGGAARAYPTARAPDDPFQSKGNQLPLSARGSGPTASQITMHRLEFVNGKAVWTQPDSIEISSRSDVKVAKAPANNRD